MDTNDPTPEEFQEAVSSKRKFLVTLVGVRHVDTQVVVMAESEREAAEIAMDMPHGDLDWNSNNGVDDVDVIAAEAQDD